MIYNEGSVNVVALFVQINCDELKIASANENTSRHTIQLYLAI